MRRHLFLACCVWIWMTGRDFRNAAALGGDVPSAAELRTLVVEPLRGLQYGTYKTRVTDNILRRTATKHITFKRDCIRVDTFGLESVTVVRRQSGETTPYVVAPGTSFVAQEAICGEEYVTYNPAKDTGRQYRGDRSVLWDCLSIKAGSAEVTDGSQWQRKQPSFLWQFATTEAH